MKQWGFAATVLCMGMVCMAFARVPEGGKDLLPRDALGAMRFSASGDPGATGRSVDVDGMPFKRAMRVITTRRPKKSWGVIIHVDVEDTIRHGDVLLLSFFMRGLKSEDESGDAIATWHVQRNRSPWGGGTSLRATAGREWRQIHHPFVGKTTLKKGQSSIAIHLGYLPQSLEIGGLRLVNYGKDYNVRDLPHMTFTYEGQGEDAAWRQAATKRIEKHRKAPLSIRVVDERGQPVSGAKVRVTMKQHSFGFGTTVNTRPMTANDADGRRYRELLAKSFNKGTTEGGLRWQNWFKGPPHWITYEREALDKTLDWLRDHDMEVRGHYLMWAPVASDTQPGKLIDKPNELRAAYWKHVEEKTRFCGKRIGEWDAINHIIGWGRTYADILGGNAIYADVIRRGRELAPHAEMWVNEGQILPGGKRRDSYEGVIRDLIRLEAKPDGIGFMGHFTSTSLTPIEGIHEIYNRYAALVPNLQVTELDVDCGYDDELQADYLRDVLTISFAHPAMEGIVQWGFWAGRHWRPNAALWQRDWTIKPAGEAYLDLVYNRWWTDESGRTDDSGVFGTRGFLGAYEVEVESGGVRKRVAAELMKSGATVTVPLSGGQDARPTLENRAF